MLINWKEEQKSLFGEEEKKEVETIWCHKKCAGTRHYLGQILGFPSQSCVLCGGFDGLLLRYEA